MLVIELKRMYQSCIQNPVKHLRWGFLRKLFLPLMFERQQVVS